MCNTGRMPHCLLQQVRPYRLGVSGNGLIGSRFQRNRTRSAHGFRETEPDRREGRGPKWPIRANPGYSADLPSPTLSLPWNKAVDSRFSTSAAQRPTSCRSEPILTPCQPKIRPDIPGISADYPTKNTLPAKNLVEFARRLLTEVSGKACFGLPHSPPPSPLTRGG